MDIGDLKHRVTFQRFTTVVNDNGFEEETWQDYKTVWASVSNLYGREYFEAAAIQEENTVKFTIRFIKEINESMRIKFRDKQYSITSIDNIKYENKFIEIKAMEVDKSG
ncbi:phage head closure protein [Clostridium sporogenes]|uniref:phage head closure protein n=1 Tax=Clostridium sporogenes TaxID=1509 RepID=UPI00024BA0CC|nr:phage head closure protein [Clostridium sporogenes]EHN13437.1 phage head-tail adaptor [Clostridium sporogenes PA 3679]MDU4596904.1 phage head closure protein [Clostridium sporogenes]NFQ33514.1 head-tail adaptor protein [Clostridium sporogenes]NFQ59071.1 head-tail adaptor protein [Clostridium sporogenes]NFU09119.1 head-tail adaptor protein [Clostridium sporogenes]